jgi:septum formation protein
MTDKKLILASASPRRSKLLKALNIDFEIIPADIEENIDEDNFSPELIEKLALEKAQHIAAKIDYPAVIVGADTVVVIDDHILGKPTDDKDAFQMLSKLSGRTHKVISAIAVIDNQLNIEKTDHVISEVTFREISPEEIKKYIKTGEPADKAGAYAIQGIGSCFITAISGCYENIVGISISKLAEMLNPLGFNITYNR